jgi:signal peptidase I
VLLTAQMALTVVLLSGAGLFLKSFAGLMRVPIGFEVDDRLAMRASLGEPGQGDIVVFEDPDPSGVPDRGVVGGFFHWMFEGLGVQRPDSEDFIKRVIGTPGDTVVGREGQVFVNGEPIDEPYLTQPTDDFKKTTVPDGRLFVMGDNRGNSLDSRFTLGFVPIDSVIGKAEVVIWPPGDLGLI